MLPQVISEKSYFFINRVRGRNIRFQLQRLKETEHLTTSQLDRYRLNKLKYQLNYVINKVPFYREWAKKVRFDVGNIKSTEILKKLPILERRILVENLEKFIDKDLKSKPCITSGSSGNPMKFVKDINSLTNIKATGWQVYGWYGVRPGDRIASIWGVDRSIKSRIKNKLENIVFNKLIVSAYDQDEQVYREFYRKLNSWKPAFFYSYTTSFFRFCKFVEEEGLSFDWQPKLIVVTGEMLFDWQRTLIKRVFNDCPVANEYGSSEHGIIAFECPHGNLHAMSQNFIIEILDDNGQAMQEGEVGQIVITELESRSVPFIRYKIGDLGSLISTGSCNCGLPYEVLDQLKGRIEYLIPCPDGRLVDSSVLGLLSDKVREFRGIHRSVDELEIQVVVDESESFDEEEIVSQMKAFFGPEMRIYLNRLSSIPTDPSGKFRYFIPLRNDGVVKSRVFLTRPLRANAHNCGKIR